MRSRIFHTQGVGFIRRPVMINFVCRRFVSRRRLNWLMPRRATYNYAWSPSPEDSFAFTLRWQWKFCCPPCARKNMMSCAFRFDLRVSLFAACANVLDTYILCGDDDGLHHGTGLTFMDDLLSS